MRAMHQTDRYRSMKKSGMKEEEMRKEFQKPVEMRVFTWDGPVDTLMSPWDSIRYHKVSYAQRLCQWIHTMDM